MAANPPVVAPPLRVRIFVDFWNFSLSLRRKDDQFMVDWSKIPSHFVNEAANLLGGPAAFEGMHVYGSYDPAKPSDAKLRNWFANWLDKQAGVHTVLLPRQQKRNHLTCPACHGEITSCHHQGCGADLRGTEEKGVDTRMATDLISLAWSNGYDVAVLVSSDKDFVPVADFLQSKGIKVIHGAFPPAGSQLSQRCWGNFSILKLMGQISR
jgi:hypothetical protein